MYLSFKFLTSISPNFLSTMICPVIINVALEQSVLRTQLEANVCQMSFHFFSFEEFFEIFKMKVVECFIGAFRNVVRDG